MCFSATASFSLSGVLACVGVVSIKRNKSAPHRMFAAFPFIFAAQQAAEGFVWLTTGGPPDAVLHRLAVDAYLGVALVLWPIWAPLSLRLIERRPARMRLLTALSVLGIAVSITAFVLLWLWQPRSVITGHSITYEFAPSMVTVRDLLILAAYVAPTLVPFFVSTAKLVRETGIAFLVSLLLTVIVQKDAMTSVWCFFAAIISVLIVVSVQRDSRAMAEGANGAGATVAL
jgi:hypothetical protein